MPQNSPPYRWETIHHLDVDWNLFDVETGDNIPAGEVVLPPLPGVAPPQLSSASAYLYLKVSIPQDLW